MATLPKIMNGARALISVNGVLIGTVFNLSWNVTYDSQDAYVCGRVGPAAIEYTAMEPISGSMATWRVVDHSAFADLGMPTLQNLLTSDYTTITVVDRITQKRIGAITGVRLGGFGSGVQVRSMSEQSINFKGMLYSDETGANVEPSGSADLPS